MSKTDLTVLNDAELVIVKEGMGHETLVVWHGGQTFNVYTTTHNAEQPLRETTAFTVSDEHGEAVDRETAKEHAQEWLDEELAE